MNIQDKQEITKALLAVKIEKNMLSSACMNLLATRLGI